jgi:hypothetical protein
MCADSGAVIALSYADGRRPVLTRAVVFLASGETLWADGGPGGGSRAGLTVRERGAGGQCELRLSVQGALLPGPAELADPADMADPARLTVDAAVAVRRVPLGLELTLEPASARLAFGQAGDGQRDVTLVRGTGSLSAGSVIRRVDGSGWWTAGPGGGPGAAAGGRAFAAFQDGSALYVAGGMLTGSVTEGRGMTGTGAVMEPSAVGAVDGGNTTQEDGGSTTQDAPVAALVRNSQIRAVALGDITVRGSERGLPGRAVSWASNGHSPAGAAARATGEIRDPRQRVTVTSKDTGGEGLVAWSCAPFVFVRSGVTGLGFVERRVRLGDGVTVAGADEGQPDPF